VRMITTLSSLGLSFGVSGGAVATPVEKPFDRQDFLECRGNKKEPLLDYYRHKRYYRHAPDRADQGAGQPRLPRRPDRDGLGTTRPDTPEPVRRRRFLRISA
jgi:hypothetical protein